MSKRLTVKRNNKASLLFRNVAQGILTSKHLALGSFGRRIRARRGSGVAIKAIARKIACYYYRVMTKGEAFVDKGIALYEAQLKENLDAAGWRLTPAQIAKLDRASEQTLVYPYWHQRAAAGWGVDRNPPMSMIPAAS